ncbi:glycosyltransferase family 2 protein [Cantharellus anzutake]|uniref:glycosyltransferase family 2 protein n=1 Tax=Cantharellus anzutake TaxID=1750568 RepID=UPI001904EFB9|nr:glycosyltransferase family 2 protein [Cantharellus anzutake]KAF8318934.1 glycosyltransferase family 2 protein [Cantharellus anzutake]
MSRQYYDYPEDPESQRYQPLRTPGPDRHGASPAYGYNDDRPPIPPPPGGYGSELPNPFEPQADPFITPHPSYASLQGGYGYDQYERPASTQPNDQYDPSQTPSSSSHLQGYHLEDDGVPSYQDTIPLVPRRGGRDAAFPDEEAEVGAENYIHYGRIPQRIPRRFKTTKRVQLYNGNLVLDCPVPPKLLELCPLKNEREFTHMRYTAATCDPDNFRDEGYALRQVLYDPPRKTELFIVMTMYNEDDELFARTMHGVMKNIQHLTTRTRSRIWGAEGWKKVVVCIVSDGRSKINSRTLSAIASLGAYQDGVAKNIVGDKPVTAHIYEYTTQLAITAKKRIQGAERGAVPVQILFCLKEKNEKKINSHRWFFNAFGRVLDPNVCVLLDVGTQPGNTSIYHLWKAFDLNSNVGGACGEIVAMKGNWGLDLLKNPLVAAQNFEYKMSNILDKPLESVWFLALYTFPNLVVTASIQIFGYITVLPGAFSAYRRRASSEHGAGADIFTSNMYLAEDRILCWELVSKRGGSWILHYVKSAYAETDVPDQVPELISQRRRWLNGSFFAAIHATLKFGYIYRSSHTFWRKFAIHVEMVYQTFNLMFSWFALANFYIAFIILTKAMEDPSFNLKHIDIFNNVLQYIYLGLVVMCFLLSMGNRPQGSKWGYTTAMIGFALITVYMTFAAFFLAFKGIQAIEGGSKGKSLWSSSIFRNIVVSLLATTGLYLIASFLFFEPWHMITSFIQYILMAPSYINVLNVYAFANVHDVSWGTKGDNAPVKTDLGVVAKPKDNNVDVVVPTEEKDLNAAYEDALAVLESKPPPAEVKVDAGLQEQDYYKQVLLAWTLSNGALAVAIQHATTKGSKAVSGYMAFLLFSVAGLAFFRFCGSTAYLVVRLFAGE